MKATGGLWVVKGEQVAVSVIDAYGAFTSTSDRKHMAIGYRLNI